jgi:hypothetical protein
MSEIGAIDGESLVIARYTYPASAMVGDYLRAAAGLVPSVLLLATVSVDPVAGVVLGGFAALFGAFGFRTLLRHTTSIEVNESGLRAVGLRRAMIDWTALDRMKLAYYSTHRDRRSGWMQLELGAGRSRLCLDSRLDGFEQLVRQAVVAAAARGIELNEATAANLQALGIRTPEFSAR